MLSSQELLGLLACHLAILVLVYKMLLSAVGSAEISRCLRDLMAVERASRKLAEGRCDPA